MCPPADIGKYWSEEELFSKLKKFKSGCPLPSNVTADVNPYQVMPANLPEEIWYFCSELKKDADAEHGFWKVTGEVCEIFSNTAITGWRTTLEFYEGQAPLGRRTNWVMQEYYITEKGVCYDSKPKDSGVLCRVFLADAKCASQEPSSKHDLADINPFHSMPTTVPNAESSTGKFSKSESLDNNMDSETKPSAVAESCRVPPLENIPEFDYVLEGDYLELNDLADQESRSSSSVNSSRMTYTSEECFDSLALLQDLGDSDQDQQDKVTSSKFNLSASVKAKEVVMRPATIESIISGNGSKSASKGTPNFDYSISNQQGDNRNECTPNSLKMVASSSSGKAVFKAEKKALVGRMKKLKMKYLWFMPF